MICGVDVSSTSLDASIGRTGTLQRFTNTPEVIAELGSFCYAHQVDLVAMEATGGYERQAFAQLSEHGLPVAILKPRAVRQFAYERSILRARSWPGIGCVGWARRRSSILSGSSVEGTA